MGQVYIVTKLNSISDGTDIYNNGLRCSSYVLGNSQYTPPTYTVVKACATLEDNVFIASYVDSRYEFIIASASPFNLSIAIYDTSHNIIDTLHGPAYIDTDSVGIGCYSVSDWNNITLTDYNLFLDSFSSFNNAKEALLSAIGITKNITYRLTNCTAPGAPQSASVGSEVTVPLVFTEGFAVNNPSTDAYVMNNGVLVPSTYSNGTLTFTMP